MSSGIRTIIYPVTDLARARTLYQTLCGVAPYTDQPYYVGFRIGDQEIGLHPQGHAEGMTGPVGYWHVDDIRGTIDALVAAGAETVQEPRDVGGGRLIATVRDADGNVFGLRQDPD